MEKTFIKIEVTIARETREVEFYYFGDDDRKIYSSGRVALCKTTGKVWPCRLFAFKQDNGSYKVSMIDNRLNRVYPVVAWNDEKYTDRSRHNSA